MGELLVWPALIGYGEAAVAYADVLRGHLESRFRTVEAARS